MVGLKSKQLTSVQNQVWRSTGIRLKSGDIKKKTFTIPYLEGLLLQSAQANLTLYRNIEHEVKQLEKTVLENLESTPELNILKSINGVGDILGMTILLETGDINRFASMGNYASYCRCVKSTRISNNKQKSKGNAKSGNKYLSWAFSEAAHFAVRYDDTAKGFYNRKKNKTNGIVAIRAVAHKLARASYCMLKRQTKYDSKLAFG